MSWASKFKVHDICRCVARIINMKFKNNVKDFCDNYTHFILDVWGVIHDGSSMYEGVMDHLLYLKQKGKKICFLSNAPRRASKVKEVLAGYGIDEKIYDFILTSGEAAHIDLEINQKNNFNNFGKNYYYIGPKKDLDLLSDLDYKITDDASSANFVIATGFNDEHSVLEEKLPQLQEAIKYNLPLICVNPDLMVVKKSGKEMLCAGVLANEYEKLGGKVFYYGKPFQEVYKIACKLFHISDKNNVIAIGDGMETDIKGAFDFGIDSALVTSGILCNKLGVTYGQKADESRLQKICDDYKLYPNYVIQTL